MYSFMRVSLACCLSVLSAGVAAGSSNVQFSAHAVQSAPDEETRHAMIFVGDNRVRLEYQQQERNMVEVYDMKNQRALLLMPQQSAYMERPLPPQGMRNPMLPPEKSNPCSFVPKAECKKLGKETMHGRPVEKWEMVVSNNGESLHSLHWIDSKRHMPLRQMLPDGTVMEMRLLGREALYGRKTEKWELVTTGPEGKSMTSTQWYDPQLQIAIREELPGGYFRELRNIKVAAQPNHLFTVPAGYQRREMPKRPNNPAQMQQRPPSQSAPRYPGR